MSFGLYLLGFILLIAGLAWAAVQVGISPVWIGIGAVVLLGIGIASGVSRTRQKDPAE
jgi:predicted signal transduction protein with EAL and GGDEF domain